MNIHIYYYSVRADGEKGPRHLKIEVLWLIVISLVLSIIIRGNRNAYEHKTSRCYDLFYTHYIYDVVLSVMIMIMDLYSARISCGYVQRRFTMR